MNSAADQLLVFVLLINILVLGTHRTRVAIRAIATQGIVLGLLPLLTHSSTTLWMTSGATLVLLVASLFIVLLSENCRIPFDDPNTHLELTMIHEVMVLDHSGPAFGMILFAASLKLFILGAFFLHVLLPFRVANSLIEWCIFLLSMILLAICIGTVESIMARYRMTQIPQMLLAASVLAAFAMMLVLRTP